MKKEAIYYSDYLKLDKILNSQEPKSNEHDEMLFIINPSNLRIMV
ncbi:MAG: hypothetical protein KatS3mg068_2037 [Candidatus Sericytochromatia bacterium]|nr:MAG: hypothetical protein KatS3mg068_2037 [Candidatus Sericytochromatia bacterium]